MFGIAQSDRTHYSSGSLRKKCPLLAVESILNPDEDLDPKGTHYSLCPKTMKLYSVLCKLRVIQITSYYLIPIRIAKIKIVIISNV